VGNRLLKTAWSTSESTLVVLIRRAVRNFQRLSIPCSASTITQPNVMHSSRTSRPPSLTVTHCLPISELLYAAADGSLEVGHYRNFLPLRLYEVRLDNLIHSALSNVPKNGHLVIASICPAVLVCCSKAPCPYAQIIIVRAAMRYGWDTALAGLAASRSLALLILLALCDQLSTISAR
jgi:hypothetical protein